MLIVLKYGGNAMAAGAARIRCSTRSRRSRGAGERVVLVHGGARRSMPSCMPKRSTKCAFTVCASPVPRTRDVVEYVPVRDRQQSAGAGTGGAGCPRGRNLGQDGNLLGARRTGAINAVDLGYVGEIVGIDPAPVRALLAAGFVVVVAPLGLDVDGGGALNCNANRRRRDRRSAGRRRLCRVDQRRRGPAQCRRSGFRDGAADGGRSEALLDDGSLTDGMIPKMRPRISAVRTGRVGAVVAGAGYGSIEAALRGIGTELVP